MVLRNVSQATKREVAAAQRWCCRLCGQILSAAYEVDHVRPLWNGGSNRRPNLQALCANCHALKTLRETHQRHQKSSFQCPRCRGIFSTYFAHYC